MRTLLDSVIRPVAAFVLAAIVANCNDGCVPGWTQLSPADAYAMEVSGCVTKRNSEVMKCAGDAKSVAEYNECKAKADEGDRVCREQVDRKYLGYNSEGGYPSEFRTPGR
jgi:hypothetical protein